MKTKCRHEFPDAVTKEVMEQAAKTEVIGKTVYYAECLDSTNQEVRRQAEAGAGEGLLVIAEQQTGGKGRRGKSWSSPAGSGIWMSALLKPQVAMQNVSMLTIVAALAVYRAITELTGLEAKIKWPNDIVVNGKKVCGILTEMSSESDRIHYVVIGIGINVNTEEFPEEIRDIATSLYKEKGEKLNRSMLATEVWRYFEVYYKEFLKKENLSAFLDEYQSALINIGNIVKVTGGKKEITGKATGINETGVLLVETEQGVKEIVAGEVSVRGLYGYV